jgi:hypothetical protein
LVVAAVLEDIPVLVAVVVMVTGVVVTGRDTEDPALPVAVVVVAVVVVVATAHHPVVLREY